MIKLELNKNNIEEFKEDETGAQTSSETLKPKKKRKKISKTAIIILLVCLIVFICSSAVVIRNYIKRHENIEMNTNLESVFNEDIKNEEENQGNEDSNMPLSFDEMLKINPGFVGWIKVPNTSISLPVVKYSDNSFYLTHNFYKKYDYRGTVFMDYRNDPVDLDANTILYGHNCYDGTMFSELEKFQDIEFYKKTPVIEFSTANGKEKWKVYAVFVSNAKASEDNGYVFNYIYPYMDGENFEGFIEEVNKRRLYATDVDITDDDNMLILSTCIRKLDIYSKGKRTYKADTRLVVLTRKLRPGESEYVNTENAKVNPSPKYPQIWYDKNGIKNPYAADEKWYPKEISQ